MTHSQIVNDSLRTALSSTKPMDINKDGSVDIFFGPKAPEGKEMNWIQTVPDKAWFIFFRVYGPIEESFDRSWVLPNVEKTY